MGVWAEWFEALGLKPLDLNPRVLGLRVVRV